MEISTPTNDFDESNLKDGCDEHESVNFDGSGTSMDTMCGLGSWRPMYLQKLAKSKVYTASFITIGIVQGMIYAYFNGTITTVEKVFGISSRVIGFLLTGNDISQILCGMAVTHFGGKGSRPVWISFGMLLTAASCFFYASCQLFWDGTVKLPHETRFNQSSTTSSFGMCSATTEDNDMMLKSYSAACDMQHSNIPSMVLIFVGQFISGVGSTALFSLGFTYMDDNIKKRNSPMYIGMSTALRSFGPSLGYVLASFCLRIYINPKEKPEYSMDDPRWLGAWWLGFLIIGIIQLIISIPMLLFPRNLPSERRKSMTVNNVKSLEKLQDSKETPWKDFILTLKRLVKNPILVFDLGSTIPIMFGFVGTATFLPKYLEAQFGQSASSANISTGVSGMLMMMAGTFSGGFIIWKFQPRAIYITSWNAVINLIFVMNLLIAMGLKCDNTKFSGINAVNNELQVTSICSQSCNCDLKFEPVCMMGQNFLSPCLAGCTEINQTVTSPKTFYNCTCGSLETSNGQEEQMTAVSGYCPNTRGSCDTFWTYITIMGFSKFIGSTSRVGSIIIFVRCVEKRDKALAMALLTVMISIFSFIPGPIFFGTITDGCCLLWEKTMCGKRGNCWLYNVDQLRYWFHGLMAFCFVISAFFDILVCIYSRHLNIYDEDIPEITTTFKKKKISLTNSNTENSKLMELKTNETKCETSDTSIKS